MKYGCLAFLVLLLILVVVLAGGGAALFFGGAMFEIAGRATKPSYSAPDAQRAQDKMYELLLRDSGHSSRSDPIVLTDQELSAFLTRYLERTERIPVSLLVVKLAPNTVEMQGQTVFRSLFKGFPLHFLPDYLPATTMDRPVWVTVRGTIRLERERGRTGPNYGQLEVKEFSLGYQGIGPWLLWALLGQERLRWQVPAVVETIKIEDGRIVITTGSRPSFVPRQRRLAASTNRICRS